MTYWIQKLCSIIHLIRYIVIAVLLCGSVITFSQPISFTQVASLSLTGQHKDVHWGDYDNDGDLDILATSSVFENQGENSFVLDITFPESSVKSDWGDINNDGLLDVILGGSSTLVIYINQGSSFVKYSGLELPGVNKGNFSLGDFDNDGDLDLLQTGDPSGTAYTSIYRNDGNTFTEQTGVNLQQISNGWCTWVDYDNDGYLDIHLTGYSGVTQAFAKLYHNNGDGSFSDDITLDGSWRNSVTWGDTDGDGDLDAISIGDGSKYLYRNDGGSGFTTVYLSNITTMAYTTLDFGDYDNDGDIDLLSTGYAYYVPDYITKVYQNTGGNSYEEVTGLSLQALAYGGSEWGDYDDDGDLDILVSGSIYGDGYGTYVYQNNGGEANTNPSVPLIAESEIDGANVTLKWHPSSDDLTNTKSISYNLNIVNSGGDTIVPEQALSDGFRKIVSLGNAQLDTFFILKNLPKDIYYWKLQAIDNGFGYSGFCGTESFEITSNTQAFNLNATEIQTSSATLNWTRGNGISCVVFMSQGQDSIVQPEDGITYTGNSVFGAGTLVSGTDWYCIFNGTDNNVTVSGLQPGNKYQFQVCEMPEPLVYLKDTLATNPCSFQTSLFLQKEGVGFDEEKFAYSLNWGDYDNDGYLDLLFIGQLFGFNTAYGYIYKNNGNKTFTDTAIPIDYLAYGDAGWGDFDLDGDLDIFITGSTPDAELKTYIYENKGTGTFDKLDLFLEGIRDGKADWIDIDNDGDLDIAESGSGPTGPVFRVLRNMGNKAFLEDNYPGLTNGEIQIGDFDNDQDEDILIVGTDNQSQAKTIIFENDGTGHFTISDNHSIPGFTYACVESLDFDTDGDLDILIGGTFTNSYYGDPVTMLFENTGGLQFAEVGNTGLMNIKSGSIEAGDLDNDGDPDLILAGRSGTGSTQILAAKVYFNTDTGFVEQEYIKLPDVYGSTAMADIDNDFDLDFFFNGSLTEGIVTSLFINESLSLNTPPSAPSGLSSEIDQDIVYLSWLPITGDETDSLSITYNLGVGTNSGVYDILTPHSYLGSRLLTGPGNMGFDTTMYIKGLLPGTYYWSVQAVDYCYSAGAFSGEFDFEVNEIQASSLTASIVDSTQLKLKWIRGNGERVIVFCKQGSYSATLPLNGNTYIADEEFGYGSQIESSGWYCVYNGREDSCSVNGLLSSSYYQIMVLEYTGSEGTEYYFTETDQGNVGQFGTSLFSVYTGTTFKGGYDGDVSFIDFNNDGFLDISVCGFSNYGNVSVIYLNNGDKTFSEFTDITDGSLPLIWGAKFTWGDINNDHYFDFYMTGNGYQYKYINESGTFFTKQADADLPGLSESHFSFGDYDSDGDLDLFVSGNEENYPASDPFTFLYVNNGGVLTQVDTIIFPQVYKGSVKWLDYDNDGDMDIFISGYINTENVCSIFVNQGNSDFSRNDFTGLYYNYNTEAEIMDFQNDGFTDILYDGNLRINYQTSEGTYDLLALNISAQKSKWGDFDNDGDADILTTGSNNTKLLINTGDDFLQIDNTGIMGFSSSSMALGDFDNDGDLDALLNGSTSTGRGLKLFQNNTIMKAGDLSPNSIPEAPANTGYVNTPLGVKLYWDPSVDNETPSSTLTYNVSIGTTINSEDICPSNADITTGHRLINDFGNAFYDTTYLIRNLPQGKYYWRVQAIDQNFAGSSWTEVDSFEVRNVQAFYDADEVCLGFPTTFTDQSMATDGIASWNWDFKDGMTSTDQNPVYMYSTSGIYNVKLVITDNGGIKDSLEQEVIVLPRPITAFSAPDVCQGIPVTATNTTDNNGLTINTWNWDFGDGSTSTDLQPAPHGYLTAGDYSIKLKAVASNGCADSVTNVVSVGAYPVAAVTANAPLTFCKGDSVTLSVPYVADYLYTWKIDETNLTDGDSSRYVAKLTGNYSVEIINPKGTCTANSSSVGITAQDAPTAPLISASGYLEFCQGDSVVLSVINTAGYVYQWKLNGGAVGADSSRISAKSSGTYSLTVSNSTGCVVNATNTIPVTVNSTPSIPSVDKSGPTTFCQGNSVELSVTYNSAHTYQWKNDGAVISDETTNFYSAMNSGVYSLQISNSDGCFVETDNVTVNVLTAPSAPLISTGGALEICQGDSVIMSVTNTTGYNYQWKLNDGAVGVDSSRHSAKSSGTYSLTVSNSAGCAVDATNTLSVTVNSIPVVGDLSLSGPASFCGGDSVILSTPSVSGYSYNWRNEYGLIANATSNSYTAKSSGTYQLYISNTYGCSVRTSSVQVTAKLPPAKPVIESVNYVEGVCPGEDQIRLYASQEVPEYNYLWYKNGQPLANDTLSYLYLSEQGIYNLEAELNGCTKESDVLNINLPDAPEKPYIHAQGPTVWYLACSNTTAEEYRWYCNGNLIERANKYYYIAGRKMGDYQVSISNSLGCFTRSDIVTIPTGDTGTDDVDPFEGLKIYPNPTNGLFVAEIENGITGNLLIRIISQDGKELFNFMFEKTSDHFIAELNISEQPEGYYLIIFELNKHITVRRIIID